MQTREHNALLALDRLLSRQEELIGGMDDALYTSTPDAPFESSIGAHMRHTLDHIRALFFALNAGSERVVRYDRRERGTAIEQNRGHCLAVIGELRREVQKLDPHDLETTIQVEHMLSGDGVFEATTSTIARELVFVMHHALHHNAIIAIRLRRDGWNVPADFGQAPATIHFESARS